ncbi:MAG: Fic family protein [Gammaproteobacteria bacterium]|nr:Fic family protein [Gammaproteobacteria bacterium]MDD9874675.1 Fic family protein [Gammaproteobacteria bacterium]
MKIPLPPPAFGEAVLKLTQSQLNDLEVGALAGGRYLHWDELRHRAPPAGLTHETWWAKLKLARHALLRPLPLYDKRKRPILFATPDPVLHQLHRIDQRAAGSVGMETPVVSGDDRNRYLVNSLIEEAITSSQLEGAATTRREARAMLRSGRRPRDPSERMILNNYHAMETIRDLREYELTPERVMHLHRVVVDGTLDDPGAEGRLRKAGEPIQVVDAARATVLHDPPPAASLPKRLQRLCAFANAPTDGRLFVHPVIRAVLLHFMLGYDHPFVDGNGRTARALFYWSMARSGYWLMEYVSISRLLRRAPAKYIRAYLHTETDANDATYFIVHQLEIIERAIEELHRYLEHKAAEQRGVEALLRHAPRLSGCLNHRQIALLGHALRHTGYAYTVESHRRSHRVTPQTARVDLQNLVHLKLLEQTKRSRAFRFYAPDDLRERIAGAAGLDGEDERCG